MQAKMNLKLDRMPMEISILHMQDVFNSVCFQTVPSNRSSEVQFVQTDGIQDILQMLTEKFLPESCETKSLNDHYALKTQYNISLESNQLLKNISTQLLTLHLHL